MKLTSELSYWHANIKVYYYPNLYVNYDNGQGCSANASLLTTYGLPEVLYFGWKGDARLDYYLEGPSCDSRGGESVPCYLGRTKQRPGGTRNNTSHDFIASLCDAFYDKQAVSVKIARNESRPVEVVPLGPTRTLNSDEFNNTAYGFSSQRRGSTSGKDSRLACQCYLEYLPVLLEEGVSGFSTNLVIYGLDLLEQPASALKERTVLHEAIEAAHRALFSIAVPHLVAPIEGPEPAEGLREYTVYGMAISRPIFAAIKALLFLVAIFTSRLLIGTMRSPSKLSSDPSSMDFTFRLVRASDRVLNWFRDPGSADDKILRERLSGERYALVEDESAPGGLRLDVLERTENIIPTLSFRQHVSYLPVHPESLRAVTGSIFSSRLVGGIIVLVDLKFREHELNGEYHLTLAASTSYLPS